MHIFVIYFNPSDYPGRYVLRQWIIDSNQIIPTTNVHIEDTIKKVRKHLPKDVSIIVKNDMDDPCIVETWI